MPRDPQIKRDLDSIIDACTCVGTLLDELTLLRVSLRLYGEGHSADDAVAQACKMLSDSITKTGKS